APVFWVQDWRYIAACVLAATAIWMLGARTWRFRALLWLDAAGLAAYGVMGAAKAATYGVAPLICVVMGVLTACFGGVVRDVLAGQPSILLRRELNITAALLSAGLFVTLKALTVPTWPAVGVAVVAGFGLRAGALKWGWSLPAFPSAPTRN
ncbi:trimeric intracellular cation channel family protein, partial [Brevundimonas sp. P7753]|uniref:trimeric intracellular cation channel family protein n=2 Tax=Brevundimonas TaxID=41275 RepID=UPI002103AE42